MSGANKMTARPIYGKRNLRMLVALYWTMCLATTNQAFAQPTQGNSISDTFTAVPISDPHIQGFAFPEDPAKISGWINLSDNNSIAKHGWGIWSAMTKDSGQKFQGQSLRVYETWETVEDIQASTAATVLKKSIQRRPNTLVPLKQFQHGIHINALDLSNAQTPTGFVKFDPSAANHIRSHNLFSASNLHGMVANGIAAIPSFPVDAISIKAVYRTTTARYLPISIWPGSPVSPKPFPPSTWGACVWVDTQDLGKGKGDGSTATACSSTSPKTNATYGLANFIYFKTPATGGGQSSVSILLGMHITSREITEWTWQTFWWVPRPDQPTAPSSPAIAALRPAILTGAPAHYAMCNAYQNVSPSQPPTGGQNIGESIYCFNPYLEASFGPDDLPDSIPGTYNGQQVKNNVGMQTNCMSCHAAANYNPNGVANAPAYSGDRYRDLNDSRFKGTLQLDFSWSIGDNAK
jgi:hypothetical protein